MEKGITLTPSDVNNIIEEYGKQRAASSQIAVKLSGVNNLDVLLLLQIMSKKEPEIVELEQACEIMLDNQSIEFWNGDTLIASYAYNRGSGNKLHLMFVDEPYLYDILQQTVYALMLKKLTPHLESSK